MADLITLSRAKEFLVNPPSSDDTILSHLVSACSATVEKYCERTFTATNYDETYSGDGTKTLLLKNFPIVQVDRVSTNVQQVLSVRYAGTDASRAVFRVSSSALVLTKVVSGTTTTTSLAFATYPTLTALANAINALTNWQAFCPVYGTWPSADLVDLQGTVDAREGTNWLLMHVSDCSDYRVNEPIGELLGACHWNRGFNNYRVQYQAGFTSVPEDIQQATAELVAAAYKARGLNPNVASETLGMYSYTLASVKGLESLSVAAKETLNRYRARRIPRFKEGWLI